MGRHAAQRRIHMNCPICGNETGIRLNGVPFCIYCESQQQKEYRPGQHHAERPSMYQSYGQLFQRWAGWILFAALVIAAICEVIFW
jgi:hypothetical protein